MSITLGSILLASCSTSQVDKSSSLDTNYNLKTHLFQNVKVVNEFNYLLLSELKVLISIAESKAINSGSDEDLKIYRKMYKALAVKISLQPVVKVANKYTKSTDALLNNYSHKIINEAPHKKSVFFEHNSSVLNSKFSETVDVNASFLKSIPESRVMVAGFADLTGDPEYNLWLGKRRAKAVAEALISMGVNPDQISVVSYGESHPVTARVEEFGKNRRVEFLY